MQTRHSKREKLEETSKADAESEADTIINGQTQQTVNANIFDNDVVFCLIGDYLWISDLKILRQTSKSLLTKVNGLPKFVQNLKLTITDETIKELNPQCPVDWRNARIVVIHTSRSSYQRIPSNSITDLQLDYPIELNQVYETPKSPGKLSLNRSNCYKFLRSSIFNLKSLTFDINLLRYNIPTDVFSGLVATLEDLTFTGEVTEDGIYLFDPLPPTERRNIEINMTMIGSLAWRLKSVIVYSQFEKASAAGFTGILVSSRNTIERIKFKCVDAFPFLIGIHELEFPLLTDLQFTLEKEDFPAFAGFLILQPNLESLHIPLDGEINLDFLEAVKETSLISKLYKLQFTDSALPAAAVSRFCNFIKDLSVLKEFAICSDYIEDYENTLTDILSYLPSTLVELKIWEHKVSNDIVESIQDRLVSAFVGFPNLSVLSFHNCGQLLTDDVLQAICRSCTSLRGLSMRNGFSAHRDCITDFGLTGEKRNSAGELESSGTSLRGLKGLRELCMDLQQTDVSAEGLVKAIQFRELRVAVLSSLNIPDEALFQIAKNNPSLEGLSRTIYGRTSGSEFAERKRFSRLLSINPRLTRMETNYVHEERGLCHSDFRDMCHRPSYGVPGRTLDASTIRRIRSTMRILNSAEYKPDRMYCYDL